MSFTLRCGLPGLLLLALAAGRGLADNPGQDDLDRATQAKLQANSISDLGEVIALLDSAVKKGLDEPNTKLANELMASTRIQRGTEISTKIFAAQPANAWQEYRRIALDDLEKGVQLDPGQPQALILIAQLNLLPEGDMKRAAQALDQAVQKSKDEPDVRAKALMLRAEVSKDPEKKLRDFDEAVRIAPRRAKALQARAEFHVQQKHYEQALADYDAILADDPENVAILEERAEVLIAMKRYDDAVATLDKVRKLQPREAVALVNQGRAYALKGEYEPALKALNEAETMAPGNPVVLLLRASVLQAMDKDDKALDDVDHILRDHPQLPEALRLRAMLLAGQKKFDQAIADLESLRLRRPDDPDTLRQLAFVYQAAQRPRKALPLFNSILSGDADNAAALRGRADSQLSIGKQAEAVADYEKVLKLEADDTTVLNNLAWVLATSPDAKLRDGKRAVELATKACELTKYKQAHILSTLAAAYAETGDFATARKWSEKAVQEGSDDQKEALRKELESYKTEKPIRELQNVQEPADEPLLPGLPKAGQSEKKAEEPAPQPEPDKVDGVPAPTPAPR